MSALGAWEALVGRQVRRLIGPLHRRRHRRILRRGLVRLANQRTPAGWWADDDCWYPSSTPPRRHNHVVPLVNGEAFFTALTAALTEAEHYVYIAGWCLTPHLPLARRTPDDLIESRLLTLLSATAARVPVRVLLWAGAPVLLQPTNRTMEAVAHTVATEGTGDLQCHLDRSAHARHCHHQKAIVVDGRVAFVGGMDLTTFGGDRWDTADHPLRAGPNWHDVQVRIEGEAVADVEANFRQRWTATTGHTELPHREPTVDAAWETPVQIVRTIAAGVYPFAPNGEYGISHTYLHAIRRAQRLIYLENQYLWSPDIVAALLVAMDRAREAPLRIVIVLPAHANDDKYDNNQHVEKLREADRGRGIVSVYSPYASGPNVGIRPFSYRATYVHAKVAIIDDEWLTIGSANLNNRGLITDSEINAVICDAAIARALRIDLWAEHLGMSRDAVERTDPIALVDGAWTERAAENEQIMARGDRPLVGAVRRYEGGKMPGSRLLEEVQALVVDR